MFAQLRLVCILFSNQHRRCTSHCRTNREICTAPACTPLLCCAAAISLSLQRRPLRHPTSGYICTRTPKYFHESAVSSVPHIHGMGRYTCVRTNEKMLQYLRVLSNERPISGMRYAVLTLMALAELDNTVLVLGCRGSLSPPIHV